MKLKAARPGHCLGNLRKRLAMSPLGAARQESDATTNSLHSIFEVALNVDGFSGSRAAALQRLYAFTAGTARCRVGPELSRKYGMEEDHAQMVVSVTNKATLEQAWFNEVRSRKPQTFAADGAGLVDPTDGGRRCDFCSWQTLTAEDAWGRIERPHAVTGSNLFKYGAPAHGLVLFKHHDPLTFSHDQLADFLAVSEGWFLAAATAHPDAPHPFFLWNCGPRAGASQFHGHGQLMLTRTPVPAQALLAQQAEQHALVHPGATYYADMVRAHAAVGLVRVVGHGSDRCWLLAHLAPQKDMEVLLLGRSLTCPAFVKGLHAALRAMVDELGVQNFNCGILNVPLRHGRTAQGNEGLTATNAIKSTNGVGGFQAAALGDCGEVTASGDGGEVTASGDCGEVTASGDGPPGLFPGAGRHRCSKSQGQRYGLGAGVELELQLELGLPDDEAGWRPLMARVVSRGRMSSPASDFGCLEVVGHASIGHTDPFMLVRAIDKQLTCSGE